MLHKIKQNKQVPIKKKTAANSSQSSNHSSTIQLFHKSNRKGSSDLKTVFTDACTRSSGRSFKSFDAATARTQAAFEISFDCRDYQEYNHHIYKAQIISDGFS